MSVRQIVLAAALSATATFGLGAVYLERAEHAANGPLSSEVTVDGRNYPVCAEEDCSDQPGQIGVWTDPNTGTDWLSVGERSVPVTPGPVWVDGCGWDPAPDDDAGCAD